MLKRIFFFLAGLLLGVSCLAQTGVDPGHLTDRWRRKGLKAFDADREAATVRQQPLGQEEGSTPA